MNDRKRKWLAVIFTLLAFTTGAAAVQAPVIPAEDGVYMVNRLSDHADPGLLPVTTASGPRWAEVGVRAPVAIPSVRSMNSANNQYSVDYSYIGAGPCGASLLRVDGEWRFQERSSLTSLAANARGSTSNGCMVHTEIADPSQRLGNRIASVLGTTPMPWVITGDRVTGSFAVTKPVFHVGEDVEIAFTMRNPSDAPDVQRMAHGSPNLSGGPEWDFQIRRDGRLVKKLSKVGSSISTSVEFPPGSAVAVRAKLQDWSDDLHTAGHYVVECSHTERFSSIGSALSVQNAGGTQQFTGTIEFDIQP